MLFEPQSTELKKHIDHYWIERDATHILTNFSTIYAYPGITPDMIIVLDGSYTIDYMGKRIRSNRSRLFSFIHKEVILDVSELKSFIIIKFKSRALSSLLPFIATSTDVMMRDSVAFCEDVFGPETERLIAHLKTLTMEEMSESLDEWFHQKYNASREGFMTEMALDVSAECDLSAIMDRTNLSYSTVERYFKKEAGLTPKRFQSLQRYKKAIRELYTTGNTDWHHYIEKYGYYDQSHFIKEVKRFTSFTPSQLLDTPAFIQCRPKYL